MMVDCLLTIMNKYKVWQAVSTPQGTGLSFLIHLELQIGTIPSGCVFVCVLVGANKRQVTAGSVGKISGGNET